MSEQNLSQLFADPNLGLDDDAVNALDLTVDKLGPAIMAGLGDVDATTIEQLGATEVMLVTLLIDDSWSIEQAANTNHVIDGHNMMLDALMGSKAAGVVLVSCSYLNGNVLYPFVTLDKAKRMTRGNYQPNGGTPLYDQFGVMLAGVVAKRTELENSGITVRGAAYVVSDGEDTSSRTHQPRTLKPIAESLLRTETQIVGGMGITDGRTPFDSIFGSMGIPKQWILTPGNTPSEIRRAFGTISQSAVRASQAAGTFSQTAMGGFGTN